MSDDLDWSFVTRTPKQRSAQRLSICCGMRSGSARANIVREIIEIVRQVANGLPPGPPDPLDDDMATS